MTIILQVILVTLSEGVFLQVLTELYNLSKITCVDLHGLLHISVT